LALLYLLTLSSREAVVSTSWYFVLTSLDYVRMYAEVTG
jgi:hypothetical protein